MREIRRSGGKTGVLNRFSERASEFVSRSYLELTFETCFVFRVLLQALKYSFQTTDYLCFVMEYVNGGEVCWIASSGMIADI